MASIHSAVTASQHFLKLLSVDEKATDKNQAIKEKLEEVQRKLDARFSPKLTEVLPAEEQSLAKGWQAIKENWHQDLISDFGFQITFKNPQQLTSFQQLVRYSDRLEPLDSDLKGGLAYIVNHAGVDKAFPNPPAWLQLAKVLVAQDNFTASESLILMSREEKQALVADIRQGQQEYYARESERLKKTALPSIAKDISALGCRWVKVTQTEGKLVQNSGHTKGQFMGEMEPQLLNTTYTNTSLFALSHYALKGALGNIKRSNSPNPETVKLLEKLIESADDPDARWSMLRKLKREYRLPK